MNLKEINKNSNVTLALAALVCWTASFQAVAEPHSEALPANLATNATLAQQPTNAFQWGASIRSRLERKQDFNFDNSSQDYVLTRARLHANYTTPKGHRGYIELQDARVAGESSRGHPPVNSNAKANVFEDHLDIHQANWSWKLKNTNLLIGRQKFQLGDGRLVASLEWVNTARVSDGIRLTWGSSEKRQVDMFLSRPVAIDPNNVNDQTRIGSRYLDSNFHGAFVVDNATLKDSQLQYWLYHRENRQFGDEVSTIGMRFTNEDLWWQPDLQVAYQFGHFDNNEHSAWMIHGEIGYNFKRGNLNLAYSFASGDSDPSDTQHGTFDNLYPSNHPYYGYMDFFSLQNVQNLELRYSKQVERGTRIYIGWNTFWLSEEDTDAWYHAGLAPVRVATKNVSPYVGKEIDVALQVPLFSGRLALLTGVSAFFAGSYLKDLELNKNALFYYVNMTYTIH